nr:MAG TPA: hypothetical protein [Caudoviricetes sp.]
MGSIAEGHKCGKTPARAGWRAGRGLESLDCWMEFPFCRRWLR